jgi:ribosome-associated protein
MKRNELRAQVAIAVRACQGKKAANISILRLDEQASGFTDYFVVCSGANPRQVQAIADEVDEKLSASGVEPSHREGYNQADWVLLDYVDFVVHIFSENARKFYDLERLWKTATRLQLADLEKPVRKPAAKKTAASAKRAKAAKSATKFAAKSTAKPVARKRGSTARSRKSS